ncbi:DUF4345 domain-containing protein [Roseiconus nitratireducens]|uniref:DUF4345 domain-containing protein n=1 Tax=Roseiconus nitratireducens TaxID=2605748 RepID=A0A5M6CKX6_9BACT|nr:DUF4345 family protein [Roseiconus nitratireducens]KAA5535687.1 DUF4345 domain-containing protein [Roseiconus nitratireducens]
MSKTPTAIVLVTAITWAAFAVWLGTNPDALLPAFGVEASSPQMLTEVRAFYGGVEFAIATAMILLWWRGELFASLLVGGLPLFGSACGRIAGLAFDGYSTLHLGFATLELVGAAFCLAGCLMIPKPQGDTN